MLLQSARLSRSHFFATQLRNNSGDDDVIELMFCNRVYKLIEYLDGKAELVQVNHTLIICLRNFINKKVGNRKN